MKKQPSQVKNDLSRRRFMYGVATVAGAAITGPHIVRAAEVNKEKIRVGCVGCNGKGSSDVDQVAGAGGEVMGLCDVDENNVNNKAKKFPNAQKFNDFRKMFDKIGKDIDAVTVSIPDHNHGIVAGTALKMGKHVYCQKPLTQTVYEARELRKLAAEKKVATQMGNQGSAGPGLRRAVEVIQAGVIGHVSEVHVWSNRPVWPQGLERPKNADPVPANLNWDAWLGPAKERPYNKAYLPFNWRGWFDFGTGALGDMACHTVNMPFRAVKMGYPTVVEVEIASKLFPETFPRSSRIRYEFPERDGLPPLKFWWYDGNPDTDSPNGFHNPLRPSADITKEIVAMRGKLPTSGALLIGEKGKIFSPDDYGSQFYVMLKDEKKYMGGSNHEAVKNIPQTIPRAPGKGDDQAMKIEWFNMIKDGTPSYSNFDIAAYLTEIILLGSIAMRVGEGVKMEWDGPNMKSPNVPEAAQFVKRDSRPGWEI
jgi:hypothetical protein